MRYLLLLSLLSLLIAIPSVFAQNDSITISIKNFQFELIDPSGTTIYVYQDNGDVLYRTVTLTENPQTISGLLPDHGYVFKVVRHGITSATTSLMKVQDSPVDILIPSDGGMKFKVKFKDGAPIPDAKVIVKSLDNTAWITAHTDSKGETGRYWIQSTTADSFYYAEVLIQDKVSYIYSPVKTQSGLPQDFIITTPWPRVIDKIEANIIKENRKVGTYDGIFLIELYDSKKMKIAQSSVNKGTALFTLLPIDQYEFKVFHKQNQSDVFELWSVYTTILTNNRSLDIERLSEYSSSAKSCNCVAFRLDDVQDYYLSNPQKAIIQTFDEKSAPLTIGVIGGLIGSDVELVNLINNNLKKSNLEIASHSWNNSPITIFDKIQQEKILKDTNQILFNVFGVTPRLFIPPENIFDENTIELLQANGFTHLSSSFNYDSPPFQLSNSTFYRFPHAAQTARLDSVSNLWVNENRTKIFNDIESSVASHGFAVVMMHPPEFSINDLGIYKNEFDQKNIDELSMLIDQIRAAGYTIVPISQINLDSKPMSIPSSDSKEPQKTIHCNCVAFRIDNVQDFWLNDVQKELIHTFEEKDTDITIGILGKFFGEDPLTVQTLNSTLNSKNIKLHVANSGWEFIDHSKFGVEEQSSSIKKTSDKINFLLNKKPSVFIPPLGMFNDDTIISLSHNDLELISSNLQQDKFMHSDSNKIAHLPSTLTATDVLDDDPFVSGSIGEQSLQKINEDLKKYGYSVISLQIPDFATRNEQISQNEIDDTRFEKLTKILDVLKENNIKVVTLNLIPRILWENSLEIPDWVKNNAGWWSEGTIGDDDFTGGIEYMIKEGILKTPQTPSSENSSDSEIPDWVRNNAGWWSGGLITDGEFVLGLEYLIKTGIIHVSQS